MSDSPPENPAPPPAKCDAPKREPRWHMLNLLPGHVLKGLKEEQFGRLEEWILVGEASNKAIIERCEKEFQLKVPSFSIANFRRALKHIDNRMSIAERKRLAGKVDDGNYPDDVYQEALGLVGDRIMELKSASDTASNRAKLFEYMKTLSTEHTRRLRERQFLFEREKWEFDISEKCLEKYPKLHDDPALAKVPYKEKIRLIRLKLFGTAP